MKLSTRVSSISPSATLAISARAKELKKQGADVLDFGVGEPDFHTPPHVVEATIQALKAGKTKYTPASGTVEMKEAVIDYYAAKYEIEYELENVIITAGAKYSLYNFFQATIDEGDEVIIPAPYWVSYYAEVKLAMGSPVIIETHDDTHFKISPAQLEEAITDKTVAIILNSPSNPTGAVYTKEELLALAEVCVKHNVLIVYDEVYESLLFGKEHVCLATLSPEIRAITVLINSVSKTYSMTGFRVGFTLADKKIVKAMNMIQSHSTSNPVSFAMEGAITALRASQSDSVLMRNEFQKRRDYLIPALNELPGVRCTMPDGAFYAFPNISELLGKPIGGVTYETDTDFCKGMIENEHIALVPGTAFGSPGYIRLSYANSLENIKRGVERLHNHLTGK